MPTKSPFNPLKVRKKLFSISFIPFFSGDPEDRARPEKLTKIRALRKGEDFWKVDGSVSF